MLQRFSIVCALVLLSVSAQGQILGPIPTPTPIPEPTPEPEPTPVPEIDPSYTLTIDANTAGWEVGGTYVDGPYYVTVTAQLRENDSTGAIVDQSTDAVLLVDTTGSVEQVPFEETLSDVWNVEVTGGTYVVVAEVSIYYFDGTNDPLASPPLVVDVIESGSFSVPYGDPRTPGYWKNHPEAWPLDGFQLGNDVLTQAQLMDILWTEVRGDITIILAKHTIASTLNLANGTDPVIQPEIDAAQLYLAAEPVGSRPNGATKQAGVTIKDYLDDYNNL